jgi:tetratricopeptide (TPR) repeat protein
MQMAIQAGSTQPENVAWCETQLGDDYMGDAYVLGAEQMYRTALRTFPHYAPALAGLAAVEFAKGHTATAARYYQQAIAVVPLPQYVIALGDLYAATGNRKAAEQEYALVRFIDHLFAINHVQYGIETALFDADHNRDLAEALGIARATERTRKDVTTEDTLAWVLYKNGHYAEAWRAEQRALRLGTKNALFCFHAGMILAARGDVFGAQHFLSGALMLNPNFHALYAPVARAELRQLSALAATRTAAGGAGS